MAGLGFSVILVLSTGIAADILLVVRQTRLSYFVWHALIDSSIKDTGLVIVTPFHADKASIKPSTPLTLKPHP